ncbi:hypothetical protein JI739_22310 [Ramlibacter sp. AW1]|uniref:Uncharacterized protein n=1 Tax=Ramlibacter aurantiacus TaxID=2801330 RepID=A0A936ZSZ8_9BURK|nr:hypothetical protein [Ramlibacter aurantiacus]MBL0423085.1 hypothetical protein [Ramlibacter aurantiacus]
MNDLRALMREFPFPGRLEAIFLRPARGRAALGAAACEALDGLGLEGDRAGFRSRNHQVAFLPTRSP